MYVIVNTTIIYIKKRKKNLQQWILSKDKCKGLSMYESS